jgi:DNA replication protein DnaC
LLDRVLEDAIARRAQKPLALRVRRAARHTTTTLEGCAWHFNPSTPRHQVLHVASGDDLRQKRHGLICGPTGVGTRHLAHALAHEACRQACDGRFVNTHKMLPHLPGGRADGTWAQRLQLYRRPERLVLDDVGLQPLVDPAPSDRYDVMNERDEVGRMLVTRNRAPTAWPDLFGHPLLASAGLERLAPHAETVVITGRSFRAQGRQLSEKIAAEPAQERR